ncbi:MAG: DNA glycosylase AlkZ-like family protein, partial [Gaiellaceae bacterium]
MSVLDAFSAPTRAWFEQAFDGPTPAQELGWPAIARGGHTLIQAPTGSGKTLAAFLYGIDRLNARPGEGLRLLYVSPLKALNYDIERNLRGPLAGLRSELRVGVRTGDTPQKERAAMVRKPPDILITTPESLFLLLTSQARETLRGVETVIVDEVHAVAGTKRGAHLALSLERLQHLVGESVQRIGLSATQRPLEEIGRFVSGGREIELVDAGRAKELDLKVVVPLDDMREPEEQQSIWPSIYPEILQLVRAHRSTIVFVNNRRLAERLALRLNDLASMDGDTGKAGAASQAASQAKPREIARAHHGSLAREQRIEVEELLKKGAIPCLVATSSLELGIDMGAVDLVIQVESPTSVARGLQRVGRAGHQVGAPSKGVIFPKYRGDLLECAVVTRRMHEGEIEQTRIPRNPLDVLAQQVVAMTVMDRWNGDDLFQTLTHAAPYETLTREVFDGVLGMLAGAYPSDEFAELKPRLVWDRVTDTIEGRRDARVVAVTSGGTIPDRGLFGVFMEGEAGTPGRRVGELDEEMVYELRAGMHGDVIVLGASSWRVQDIGHDWVTVTPAPGVPGKLPFWKGDAVGRPIELGRALGAFVGELEADLARGARGREQAGARLRDHHDLDERAAENLLSYLEDERDTTGALPTDKRIVVERFRDELGDWRVCVHSPYGGQVHGPWALAIAARLRDRYGMDAQSVSGDDGIVLRLPETDEAPPGAELVLFDPADIEDLVTTEVGGSALFAARFRECAARALLLPRRNPGRRSPLWQQRQRSAQLLSVASKYGSFPIVLETLREVLQDVYDLPALKDLLTGISERRISVVEVETSEASPFAKSLLFGYVGAFMYEGDSPLAEKRAAALALDQSLLAELLGRTELRELLDAEVVLRTEAELQRLAEDRRARDAEGLFDVLRLVGPLSLPEASQRCIDGADAESWLTSLASARRVVRVWIAGEHRWAVVEDVARLRDALGVPLPPGVAEAHAEPVADPLGDLVSRYARTHGPFRAIDLATHFGIGVAVVTDALRRLGAAGRVVEGEFLPGGIALEWCDSEILRLL